MGSRCLYPLNNGQWGTPQEGLSHFFLNLFKKLHDASVVYKIRAKTPHILQ